MRILFKEVKRLLTSFFFLLLYNGVVDYRHIESCLVLNVAKFVHFFAIFCHFVYVVGDKYTNSNRIVNFLHYVSEQNLEYMNDFRIVLGNGFLWLPIITSIFLWISITTAIHILVLNKQRRLFLVYPLANWIFFLRHKLAIFEEIFNIYILPKDH